MRIGVDAACWANGRGYGRFARELMRAAVVHAPDDEFVFYADASAAECFDMSGPNVRLVRVDQVAAPARPAASAGSRSAVDLLRMSRAVWRERPDVFFSPSVYTYFPLPPRLAAVVTVHDAIPERFPELTLPTRRDRLFWRLKVGLALRQARLVLTVSDFAAREIAGTLGVPWRRIRVASEAAAAAYRPSEREADSVAAAQRAGVPPGARWFIYVGGFNPHKRVDSIIRAHAAIARSAAAERTNGEAAVPHLLLVGALGGDGYHGDHARIRAAIAEAGSDALVHWTGFVPDGELRHLLSGAIALLLPSDCEGFGLPAVEAAACGTPVVATTASPLPQLLAGGGVFIPPRDPVALEVGMRTLLADEEARREMGACARARAAALSWSQGARTAIDVLREAAS